ncbi:metal ABC transporter solute-binding protein, Zn/Mn family [uncultured Limosilactobacillus sp.]|uniref:metal ABC transporter solute-binding protein, Zn/Mn family n=1 Tax=uncultured Limosilactobacillus sp. TaxID=2837629 RepID=UPI0025D92B67|nr:zinc ABC transporter substrate-binding protein [uncultured Limosilactobacillus sp.]
MNKKWWGLAGLITSLVIILILMITGWQPHQQHRQRPIRVVTSLNFYGEVAKSVAGKYGNVTSFINSSAVDVHDFQPSTKQAQQLAEANVVIENGLGYDAWLQKMTAASGRDQAVINVGKNVAQKKAGDNEHVWYQPRTMEKLAQRLAAQYAKLDPQHRTYYYSRARKYQQQLAPLNHTIDQAKQRVQRRHNLVLVSEPVFDYALENLGYRIDNQHFAKAVEDDNDPSPKDITEMQRAIRQHRVVLFVNNKQESNSTVKNMLKLARQEHVPVLNVTETKPQHETYLTWMQKQYQQLIKIQKRGE